MSYRNDMDYGNEAAAPTAGRDPGNRAPAPGSLRLVQALVNTLNAESGKDLLASADDAARWVAAAGLLPAGSPVSGAEQRALVELREAIRQVLGTHTDRAVDAETASRLTVALSSCRLAPAAQPDGGVRLICSDNDPFARVVGQIAVVIAEAAVAGTWRRLKSCPGHRCGWAFYDRSASGRSRWCSMGVCGARSKMRVYRDRARVNA
jgi:predicted RNA-binding Zn ribbon-like protein